MPFKDDPKLAIRPEDADVDATDGGWDPYVASLLMGQTRDMASDHDDSEPVRSFSRTEGKRGR